MMCKPCGDFRRCERGLTLGGRVELEALPKCACASMERATLLDETDVEGLLPDTFSSALATYYYPMRVCPGPELGMKPYVYGPTCDNYSPSEFAYEILTRIYFGIVDGCTYDPFSSATAYTNNVDGIIFEDGTFNADTTPGSFKYVYLKVDLVALGTFIDPPILNFKYKFSPTL